MTGLKSKNSAIMSGNKTGGRQDGKPSSRHLRRSRTISVSRIVDSPGKSDSDGPVYPYDDKPEYKLSRLVPQPTLSCQALKHAVSALTRIDDFILEELGGGFFANVYKATHKVTGEEMVMKINKDTANRASALLEIQLMNKMSHPNILRFLGVCVHEGQLHALTEYISGGTLEELLANKSEELPWMLRIKLSLDIARGMHYLHSEGIFHRDLTSRNILIKKRENRNYQAVIADFGLATKIPDPRSTEPLPPVGCPWWMAPEVINGKFYDERADLFSYGIIQLEITARIEADPEVMPRTRKFGVDYIKICEMVAYCPLDFLHLAFKCCQIEPEKRPSSSVIINTLEKIYRILHADTVISSGKQYKRSKSEDNISQNSNIFAGITGEIFMSPQIVAQAMTKDDPHYCPAIANPFANMSKFKDGAKVHPFPKQRNSSKSGDSLTSSQISESLAEKQESQSLPSSPVMLRKAAEKLHLASLLGSDAVQMEDQHELKFSVSSDNQEDAETPGTVDRYSRFGGNRTRSLGSLDFWNPKYGPNALLRGRGDKSPLFPACSENVDDCDSFKAGIRESSAEGHLLSEISGSIDDLDISDNVHSEFDSSVNYSLTSYTYHSINNEEDSMEDSDSSLCSTSLSSFASCGESVEAKDTGETISSSVRPQQVETGKIWQLTERGTLMGSDVIKPQIAVESGNYNCNNFI